MVVLYNQTKRKKEKAIAKWYLEAARMNDVNNVFFPQYSYEEK